MSWLSKCARRSQQKLRPTIIRGPHSALPSPTPAIPMPRYRLPGEAGNRLHPLCRQLRRSDAQPLRNPGFDRARPVRRRFPRFRENGNRGTDHGHGSVYWVMGGGINGGRMLGEQVKVEQPALFENRDYPVLTDHRAMFAGLFERMFGLDNASVQRIFAGVKPAELGLV